MNSASLCLTNDSGVGNTNSTPGFNKSIDKKHRCMFFTLNNYNIDNIVSLVSYFKGINELLYVFQEETGEEKTPHLQGCFKSKTQIRFSTLKNINEKIHWEICRNWNQSVDYCSKKETRTGKIYTNMAIEANIKDPLEGFTLHKWQKYIINLMDKEPNNRQINWFFDKKGCAGKTSLAKHLCLNYKKNVLYTSGKAADIKYAVSEFTANKNNNLKMVIFDFTRSQESFVSYQAIEEIKNGIFFNNKYESKMVVYNSPHVVVFSNFEPDNGCLSEDRMKIKKVG